jgi:hypothetical protein
MSLMFEDDSLARPAPKRDQRLPALAAVGLIVLSWGFLSSMTAQTTRPVQSVAWVFGPAPAAQPVE